MSSGIPLLDAFVRVRFDGSAALAGIRQFRSQAQAAISGISAAQSRAQAAATRAATAAIQQQAAAARAAHAQLNQQTAALRLANLQARTQAEASRRQVASNRAIFAGTRETARAWVRAATASDEAMRRSRFERLKSEQVVRIARLKEARIAADEAQKIHVAESRKRFNAIRTSERLAAFTRQRESEAQARREEQRRLASARGTFLGGSVRRVGEIAGGILVARGIIATEQAVTGLASSLVTTNAQLEMYRISMGTLLRDQPRANALIEEIRSMAATTPFRFDNLTAGVQQFLGVGMSPEESMDIMKVVGDTAAASTMGPEALPRLVRAMSQMISFGKLNAQDAKQMTELGIPVWQILAEKMGISISQLRQMSAQGKLTGESLTLLIEGLKERYGGMMEAQAKTFSGMTERIKDFANIALQKIGEPLFNALKEKLDALGNWINSPAFGRAIDQARQFMVGFVEKLQAMITWLIEAKGTIATFLEVWLGWTIVSTIAGHLGVFAGGIAGLAAKLAVLFSPTNVLLGLLALVAAGFIKAAADGSAFGEAIARIVGNLTGIDNALTRLDARMAKEEKTNQRFADVEEELLNTERDEQRASQPPPPPKSKLQEAKDKAGKFLRDKEKLAQEEAVRLFQEMKTEEAVAASLRRRANAATEGGQFALPQGQRDELERQAQEADLRARELGVKHGRIMGLTNEIRDKRLAVEQKAEHEELLRQGRAFRAEQQANRTRKFVDDNVAPFLGIEVGKDGALSLAAGADGKGPMGLTAGGQSIISDFGFRLAQGLQPFTDRLAGAVGTGVEFAGAKARDALAGGGQAVLAKMGIDTAAMQRDKATASQFESATAAIAAQLGIDPASIRDQVLKDKKTSFVGLTEMSRQIQSGLGTKKPEEKMAAFLELIAKDGVKVKNMPPDRPASAAA